jgi:glycerophosphoryl diester phosphodiesterase
MAWAFPRVFAHRGGGSLAPENTLAALAVGYQLGFRAVEFDVMLSSDEVPVLMHDADFGRTVRAQGSVASTRAAELVHFDVGSWFDARFAGEPVPLYADVLAFCRSHGIFMNVEIKPAPGADERTGQVVAELTRDAFGTAPAAEMRPLFSSFSSTALAAARRGAPAIARGLLFDRIPEDWQARLEALECVALHCNQRYIDPQTVDRVAASGFGLFCYTVNDVTRGRELLRWGVDAICTDRIDQIGAGFADPLSA